MDEPLVSLSEVIITLRILRRKSRGYTEQFDEVFEQLEKRVERYDKSVLQGICDAAREFCNTESAGLSLFGYVDDQPVFNWEVASGKAAAMVGKMYSPRDNTPCGTVMEMYSYQVFRHPERHYRWARDNGFVIPEMITMPIYKEDMQPFGTFWLMHAEGNHFESEDIRIISMLLSLINKA
ncbi:MAG TPA: GAF domain-containing protein, partial [Methylophilaceae bacterium]|nr:GAF domain-containing protein [Methylophilaceae bacterium]